MQKYSNYSGNVNINNSSKLAGFFGNISEKTVSDIALYAYGTYQKDTGTVNIDWYSTLPDGRFTVQSSDDGVNYNSDATLADANSYKLPVKNSPEKIYIKIKQTANDGQEVNIYKTDPLKADTDGDGISDGDEVKLKLNPLNAESNGTPDAKRIFDQSIDSRVLKDFNISNKYTLSIDINAAGYADNSICVQESGYSKALLENDAIVGKVVSVNYNDLSVKSATLKFMINKDEINAGSVNYPNEPGLNGIQRFQIFKYDKTNNILYPVPTTFDKNNGTLTVDTNKLGDYCVIDMDKWLNDIGVTNCTRDKKMALKSLRSSEDMLSESIEEGEKVTYEKHQYAFYDKGMSWKDAQSYCKELGGHLVTITSQSEQYFIESLIKKGMKNSYWLGATRTSSGWAWENSENFSYENWGTTQPDNYHGNENCLMIYNAVNPLLALNGENILLIQANYHQM